MLYWLKTHPDILSFIEGSYCSILTNYHSQTIYSVFYTRALGLQLRVSHAQKCIIKWRLSSL